MGQRDIHFKVPALIDRKSFWGCCAFLLGLTGCGETQRTQADLMCKSCKPYYVRGSWHHPQTHYEYDEKGLASWYGPGFHGKPKPYGEPFNQQALTAAHRTLPLPTVVEVTNLSNGKSAIILVDDRGPYIYPGRIIDLSVASAKEIGTHTKGVDQVYVRSLVDESRALAKYLTRYGSSGRDPSGRTWRQILDQEILSKRGSLHQQPHKPQKSVPSTPTASPTFVEKGPEFTTLAQAQQYAGQLSASSRADLVKKIMQVTKNGRTFYRVRVGPFTSAEQGKVFVQNLSQTAACSK